MNVYPFSIFIMVGWDSDSFCEAKMMLGVEVADMGWDLSLKAQPRRVSMTSIQLREEGEGNSGG